MIDDALKGNNILVRLLTSFVFGLIVFFSYLANAQETFIESASARIAQISGVTIDINETSPPLKPKASGKAFWQWEFSQPGANHLRVQFIPTGFDGLDISASLSFWNQSGRLIRKLATEDIREKRLQWSDAIEGEYVLVTLRVKNPKLETKVEIKRVAVQNETSAALSIIGDDNSENIISYKDNSLVWRLQGPVARLLLIQENLPAWCTGFLISDNMMLTNRHCVRSQTECNDLKVQFNYHLNVTDRITNISQYNCLKFTPELANEMLDYTFIQIEGNPGSKFGKVLLDVDENNVQISDKSELLIIQHPAGAPKKIAQINCTVGNSLVDGIIVKSDFSHTCDTRGGSSGSPVFNAQGVLVGLHHYGFAEGGTWSENRAVLISKIYSDLEEKNISIDGFDFYE